MQSERSSSTRARDGARFVATELLREPVKSAVREALHEEATVAGTAEAAHASDDATTTASERIAHAGEATTAEAGETTDDASGRSRRFWAGLLLSTAGIAYLARRRMSKSAGWSGGSPDAGYSSEGEIQTGEPSAPADDPGHTPKTE